ADTFVFAAAGSITGALDGGGGANSVDISLKAGANTINLTTGQISGVTGTGGLTNIQTFTGDDTADTLLGTAGATTWTINATNSGSLSTGQSFTGIPNLTGGGAADSFVFTGTGNITGALDGGGGNSVNIAAVTAGANTIDLQAGTISGVVGTTFTNVTAFTGDNTADVLVGTNAATTGNINTANTGTLSTGQSFTNIPNLTGGTNNDDFTLSGGTLSGAIVGGTGSNTLAGSTAYN